MFAANKRYVLSHFQGKLHPKKSDIEQPDSLDEINLSASFLIKNSLPVPTEIAIMIIEKYLSPIDMVRFAKTSKANKNLIYDSKVVQLDGTTLKYDEFRKKQLAFKLAIEFLPIKNRKLFALTSKSNRVITHNSNVLFINEDNQYQKTYSDLIEAIEKRKENKKNANKLFASSNERMNTHDKRQIPQSILALTIMIIGCIKLWKCLEEPESMPTPSIIFFLGFLIFKQLDDIEKTAKNERKEAKRLLVIDDRPEKVRAVKILDADFIRIRPTRPRI